MGDNRVSGLLSIFGPRHCLLTESLIHSESTDRTLAGVQTKIGSNPCLIEFIISLSFVPSDPLRFINTLTNMFRKLIVVHRIPNNECLMLLRQKSMSNYFCGGKYFLRCL